MTQKTSGTFVGWLVAGLGAVSVALWAALSSRGGTTNDTTPAPPLAPSTGETTMTEEQYRAEVVRIAGTQIGQTDSTPYWVDAFGSYPGKSYSWCGVFALWCLRQAGITQAKWITSKGFVGPLNLKQTYVPAPGDIAYFTKNQHFAIVAAINDDGTVSTINGNGEGGAVSEGRPQKSSVAAFYSISSIIPKV
jgi:hypothetical protein